MEQLSIPAAGIATRFSNAIQAVLAVGCLGLLNACVQTAVHVPPVDELTGFTPTNEPLTPLQVEADRWLRQHYESINVPALSAAVALRGDIVWARAIGWSDLDMNRPASPRTAFRIGSTSKAVTVSLTGRLIDQGVVDLDEPISKYMADLPVKWRKLTLRQLHSHTAGIPGYDNNRDWLGMLDSLVLRKRYDDVADALSQFNNSRLLYEPGTSFYYSSFDVVLASAVLQAAGGDSFMDLLRAEVLEPLRMDDTAADHEVLEAIEVAIHYRRKGSKFRPWRKVDLSSKLASGGLVSTPTDLARLGAAYLDTGYLRTETVEELWTPQRLSNGDINEQYYAIGWRSDRFSLDERGPDVRQVHHGGVSKGSNAWLIIYPEYELVVAMTSNARAEEFSDFAGPAHDLFRLFRQAKRLDD